jgi:hypothetical protein
LALVAEHSSVDKAEDELEDVDELGCKGAVDTDVDTKLSLEYSVEWILFSFPFNDVDDDSVSLIVRSPTANIYI